MPRLSAVLLSVSDPAELADFYVSCLGMRARRDVEGWRVGYEGIDADILLRPGGSGYRHAPTDRYWKIGITLPNVDIAHAQLTAAGVVVSQPHQFRDIGYMCHLNDPEGFQIELLQHDFQANRPASAGDRNLSLGGGARIGQITLRSTADEILPEPFKNLGMRHLSVQPVKDLGFILHFWAFTQDTPPNPKLDAVENRAWLWKRPYTTLEIQCVDGLVATANSGYAGIGVAGLARRLAGDASNEIRPYPT